MNNKHLPLGRKLGKLSALMLMLVFSMLLAFTAKSQTTPSSNALSTNLVTFNFISGGGATSNPPEYGASRASTYRTGYTGATLDSILLSHVPGVTAILGTATTPTPIMSFNTIAAGDNCVRLNADYAGKGGVTTNAGESCTPLFLQTSVVLPAGQVFDPSAPLQLEIASATSIGGAASTSVTKGYQIYYKYYSSTPSLVTSANDTISTVSTAATVGSSGNSYDFGANSKDGSGSSSAFQLLNMVVTNASTTVTNYGSTGFSPFNDNVVSIPAPGNSTSTVIVIQIRVWGTGSAATAKNWRLAYLGLTTGTAPHAATVTPTVSGFSPASATLPAGSASQTLTIAGTGFGSSTTATYNGTALTVTGYTSTSLSVTLTAAELATAGSFPIVVSNGTGFDASPINFVVNPDAAVSIADATQPSGGNIQQNISSPIQAFSITNTVSATTLNTLKAHLTGTYTSGDIANFKVYYSTSSTFSSASLVSGASVASGTANASSSTTGSETVTFTLNKTLSTSSTNYFWVVVVPSSNANISSPVSTVQATALSSSDFSFTALTSVTGGSVSAGGVQTIVQGQTVFMNDQTTQPSAPIAQNAQHAVLAGFYLNPYASSTISSVSVYGNGSTATATDIPSLTIYQDVNGDGLYTAGTDVAVSNSVAFSSSSSTPMVFTMNQTISTKTNYIIVAQIADVNVSTVGDNVVLSINDNGFTCSNYPASGNMNGANTLVIAAPTPSSTIASVTSAATISSLVNTSGAAVAAYSFTYHNDNTNTSAASLISSIVIGQSTSNSSLFTNWQNIIGGATLSDGTNTFAGTVNTSNITFSSISTTSGSLGYVATNTTKTYTLSIYLKSPLSLAIQQGINGSQLGFALTNSSFTVTGSLPATGQSINSGTTNDVISVVPTQLAYVQTPDAGSPGTAITPAVTVAAEDANGNYATGYTGTVTISSTPSGVGGTTTAAAVAGIATFNNLVFTTTGTYTIIASETSLGLTSVSSSTLIANALYAGKTGVSSFTWETSNVWGTSSSNTTTQGWTEGDDAYFVNNAATVTVGSNHTATSLNFKLTGFTLLGTGTLGLTGSTPAINITGSANFNSPLSATSNVTFAPTTGTATMTIGANGAAANMYSANFPNGATLGLGLNTVNLLCSYPFGTTNSNLYVNSSISSPSMITTSGAGVVTTPMPLIVPNNIVISTGGALSLCPTGASLYGNIIKYTGVISGAANAICISNSLGSSNVFANGGKGMVYFGAQNTYSGTTYMAGNQGSLICGGGDNTLPYTTDLLFYTGATVGDAPFLDMNGSNEKIASISGTDGTGTTSHVTTALYPGGVYNSLTYTQVYAGTTTSLTVFDSLISSYISAGTIAVGTKLMGSGITYGTTISSITKQTIAGYTCDILGLSQTISSTLGGNQGFYVFFESPTQKTLTIEGVGSTGGPYDPQVGHTIDRTNANFGGTINGNVALTLSPNNASANKLTLLNVNTYIGATTVSSGTLKLAYASGNTIPAANSAIVNGGTLEIATNQTLASLTISSGTLLIDAGATLTITGTFTNTGGTVTNNGTFTYSNATTAFTTGGTTITNNGTFNVTAANLVVAAGTFTNASTGTVNVTNNTINVTSGTLTNNGTLASTSNLSVSGTGNLYLNTTQAINNLTVSGGIGGTENVYIANNMTTTINGNLSYGGNIQNSGTLAYGSSSNLIYSFTNTKFQFNTASEFVAPNLPATLTLPVGDTILLDQSYVFPGNLVLNGVISSLGTSFLSPNILSLTGTSKSITGNGTIGSIGIAGTISVPSGSSLNIINKLVLSSGTFTTNNNVTLKSTSIDSSAVVDVVGSGKLSGNVTVERYIPKGFYAVRDMAPQVYGAGSIFSNWQENGATPSSKGIFITGIADPTSAKFSGSPSSPNPLPDATTGLDYTKTGNPSAFYYSNNTWDTIKNTISTNLDAFQGYRVLVRGARDFNLYNYVLRSMGTGINPVMPDATVLRATGQLVTGNVTYTISGVSGTANGVAVTSTAGLSSKNNGFSMVANPYACPVQWSSVYGATGTSGINASYWYIDPTTSSVGKYIAYNALTGSPVTVNGKSGNYSTTAPVVSTGYIQAGQAVFVQSSNSTPQIVFTEASKATASAKAKVFGATAPLSKIYFSLLSSTGDRLDAAAVAFKNGFSNTVYGPQDALKFNNATDNLFISNKGKNLSIDGRLPATTSDVIVLAISKPTTTNYQLLVDATSYNGNGLSPYLVDSYKNTTTALSAGVNTIDFTADTTVAATYANRFSIVFKSGALPVNSIVASATLSNKVATITWNTVGEKNVASYIVEKSADAKTFTAIGQFTAKNTSSASYNTTDNSITATTYYRIKAVSTSGSVSYSNVAKVSTDNRLPSYSIYPNPLKGNTLNVSLDNVIAGKYVVSISNLLGQKVLTQTISHNGGSASHALTVNATMAAGVYNVTISEAGSKQVVSQTKLSVQP